MFMRVIDEHHCAEFHVCKCETSKLCMHTFIRHFTWNRKKIKHFWAARLTFHFFLLFDIIIRHNATSPLSKMYGCNFTIELRKTFFYICSRFITKRWKDHTVLTKFQKWNFFFFRKILHYMFNTLIFPAAIFPYNNICN